MKTNINPLDPATLSLPPKKEKNYLAGLRSKTVDSALEVSINGALQGVGLDPGVRRGNGGQSIGESIGESIGVHLESRRSLWTVDVRLSPAEAN